MSIRLLMPLWFAVLALLPLRGAEYFVAVDGDDSRSGLTADLSFRTIRRGLAVLKAGDCLTIAPGEYAEANTLTLEAEPGRTTTVRAAVPGTVLIRGDRPAGTFTPAAGFRFVWQTAWTQPVETVNERDSLSMYEQAATLDEMDNRRGVWYYDADNRQLYIVTTDAEAPDRHDLTVSVERNFGLLVKARRGPLHDIVIDGLSFTGFNCNENGGFPGNNGRWGLYVQAPKNGIIRRCTAFLNGGGIGMTRPEDSVIEDCVAYGNGTQFCGSGGNIICFGDAVRSTIRRCRAFASPLAGIRFYGGRMQDCLIEDCVAWNNGYDDIWIKPSGPGSWTKNSVALGGMHCDLTENTVYRFNGYSEGEASSVKLANNRLPLEDHLADPANMDFRPMSDSRVQGGLAARGDLFFVSPDGDDGHSGTSIRTPWQTLKNVTAGSTVYLLPGDYPGEQRLTVAGVTLRTRGNGAAARFRQGRFALEIAAPDISLEGIAFAGFSDTAVRVSADRVRIISCGFAAGPAGIRAENSRELLIAHNAFADTLAAAAVLEQCSGVLRDNLLGAPLAVAGGAMHRYGNHLSGKAAPPGQGGLEPAYVNPASGDFTLTNAAAFAGRGSDALPLGPYRLLREPRPIRIFGPYVASVTATTANLEWWTGSDAVTSELSWGEDASCPRQTGDAYAGACYHTVSLTGLEPGKRYYFRVNARTPPFELHSNLPLAEADQRRQRQAVTGDAMPFTTLTADSPPREFFIAPDGDDTHPGSREQPWRRIGRALAVVTAGDTITLRAGTYTEQLYLRSSGDAGRPITLRGAAGETVWLEGKDQKLKRGIVISGKNHIRLENLHLRQYGTTQEGAIVAQASHDLTLDRIFYDGRSHNYTPPLIKASFCRRLTLRNAFFTRGFHGAVFFSCPDLRVEHCVMYFNQIDSLSIHNRADEPVTLSHNLFFDNTLQKVRNPLVSLWHLEALREEYNCFHVRLPEGERKLFGYLRRHGELVPEGSSLTMTELSALGERPTTSFCADPQVPALPVMLTFSNLAEWQQNWTGMQEQHQQLEYKKGKEGFAPLDFADFFPTNPRCRQAADGRPIGFSFIVP